MVPSRLAPKSSNKISAGQSHIVDGPEIQRRLFGPENMSMCVMSQMLALGKSKRAENNVNELARLATLFPGVEGRRKPLYSAFSPLTEGITFQSLVYLGLRPPMGCVNCYLLTYLLTDFSLFKRR